VTTQKNRETVRHGDFYSGRIAIIKGSAFANSRVMVVVVVYEIKYFPQSMVCNLLFYCIRLRLLKVAYSSRIYAYS
jgi:hypothetical protein